MTRPDVTHFYHEPSGTLSYVVADPATRAAAVIDPVLGFSVVSGRTDTGPSQVLVDCVRDAGLTLEWILETHAHADHLSGAQYVQGELGGRVCIGAGIRDVQSHFAGVFNCGPDFVADGNQFDRLLEDGDTIPLGDMQVRVIATPGHTSDSITYVIGDAAFVGDTLFMPDFGTARCDFPGGDAALLYDSIQTILTLPADTRLFMCHDYPPADRPLRWETSIEEQRADNIHVGGGRSREDYVAMREARDAELNLPALLLPSIQVNIRAGEMPPAEDNAVHYLKIPVDLV